MRVSGRGRGRPPSAVPRLELLRRKGRKPQYVIYEGAKQTFLGHADRDRAIAQFLAYQERGASETAPATANEGTAKAPVDWTIAEIIADQAARRRTVTVDWAKRCRAHERALLKFWSQKTIADITIDACKDYCEARQRSSWTTREELKHLRSVIRTFRKRHNVVAMPNWWLPPKGAPRDRALTRQEVARLICAARGRTWDTAIGDWKRRANGKLRLRSPYFLQRTLPLVRMILLGAFTGTRADAMRRARWTDDDPMVPHIALEEEIFHRRGDGEPETTKRRPPARLCPELLRSVGCWSRIDTARGFDAVIPTCQRVRTAQGQSRIAWLDEPFASVSRIDMAFAAVCKNAGLSGLTMHTLRHTCASWLLEEAPLEDVAEFLGMSIDELEGTYGAYAPVLTAPASRALNEWGRRRRPGPTGRGAFPAEGGGTKQAA